MSEKIVEWDEKPQENKQKSRQIKVFCLLLWRLSDENFQSYFNGLI